MRHAWFGASHNLRIVPFRHASRLTPRAAPITHLHSSSPNCLMPIWRHADMRAASHRSKIPLLFGVSARPISPHDEHGAEHLPLDSRYMWAGDRTETRLFGRCASGRIECSAQAARLADLASSAYDAMLGRDTSSAIGLAELYNLDIDACHVTSRTHFFFLACSASARRARLAAWTCNVGAPHLR
jgi:hypothetical protein